MNQAKTSNRGKNNLVKFFKKTAIVGLIAGVVFAVINTIFMGMLGMVFLNLIDETLSFTSCTGEGCWGPFILVGDILFIVLTPFIFIFIKYAFDSRNFPYTKQKLFIVLIIIIISWMTLIGIHLPPK